MLIMYGLIINILAFWGIAASHWEREASSWCYDSAHEWVEAAGLGCYFVYQYTVDSHWNLIEFRTESGTQAQTVHKSIAFGKIETVSVLYSTKRLSNGFLQFNFTVRNNLAQDSDHEINQSIIGGYESIIAAAPDPSNLSNTRCYLYESAAVRKIVREHQGGTLSDHVLWHCNAKQACINGLTSDGIKFASCVDSCDDKTLGESHLTTDQEFYCPEGCFSSSAAGSKYDFLQICSLDVCNAECGSNFGDPELDLTSIHPTTGAPTPPPAEPALVTDWCIDSHTRTWHEANELGCFYVYQYTVDSHWNLIEFNKHSGNQSNLIPKSIAFGKIDTASVLYSAKRLSNGFLQFNFTVRNNLNKDSYHNVEQSIIGGYESIIGAPGNNRCYLYESADVRKIVREHQGGTLSDNVLWHCNAKQACINGLTSDGIKFSGCADSCSTKTVGESHLITDEEFHCPEGCFTSSDVGNKYDFLQICRPGVCNAECGSEFGDPEYTRHMQQPIRREVHEDNVQSTRQPI